MAFEIKNGPAPTKATRGSRYNDVYDTAAALKPGEWFEWVGAPRQITSPKKRLQEISKDLTIYKTTQGKVVIKNTLPTPTPTTTPTHNPTTPPTPSGPRVVDLRPMPTGPGRAQPLARPAGLTAEQREAAAARVRQISQ